jgi:hypothetical protein
METHQYLEILHQQVVELEEEEMPHLLLEFQEVQVVEEQERESADLY